MSTVGQWINSNLSALAKALSSVHVPVAELRNKPFHFSGIDDDDAQANIPAFNFIYGLAAHEKVDKWSVQLEMYQYNIDIVI